MKATILAVVLSLTAFSYLDAQVINIPDKAKKHLGEKYPDAKQVDWRNNAVNYNATFVLNGSKHTAHYTIDGDWDFTEEKIDQATLPDSVKTSVKNSRYANWKVSSTAIVENNKGEKLYRIEFKKGIEKKYLFFDSVGKEVKATGLI